MKVQQKESSDSLGIFYVERRNNDGEWVLIDQFEQAKTYEIVEKKFLFSLIARRWKVCVYEEEVGKVRKSVIELAEYAKQLNPNADVRIREHHRTGPVIIWENGERINSPKWIHAEDV